MDDRRLLERAAELGIAYVESVPDLPVRPEATIDELREAFDAPLPEGPTDSLEVIETLARDAEPGLTQMASGRYFGFVIGGALPVTLAADWLTSVWDQNAGLALPTPAAAVVEEVAGRWLKELLGIPDQASFALVTGCQMAHWTALAAARHHVLEAAGYDAEADGLAGAPPIRVIAGAKRHGTIDRAVRFLGLGTNSIRLVPADAQGRMVTDALGEELAASRARPSCARSSARSHRLVRRPERDRRCGRGNRRVASRRRGVRALGRHVAGAAPLDRRRRARRLLGNRCAQMVERSL